MNELDLLELHRMIGEAIMTGTMICTKNNEYIKTLAEHPLFELMGSTMIYGECHYLYQYTQTKVKPNIEKHEFPAFPEDKKPSPWTTYPPGDFPTFPWVSSPNDNNNRSGGPYTASYTLLTIK